MKATLKCNCGQRIFSRDVMQQGYYVRQSGPNYVYIRYRCSRCKKLGEHFVKQDEWEESALKEEALEISSAEKKRFDRLGTITIDEMVEFHYELQKLDQIPQIKDRE